ncbi:SH3 domain-containing protein [Histoplasma capsulatum var. duboisii H88]|uniref:SH3 domain-containing protein n=1 Tax=Ajellomyces capsulatus (strain H88) TaxID=544711 RepID=F0ULP4_AJEC8|nr:SH3 domain-containing protein [Histoplasma capsulatum var. duboisii H88]
MTRPQIIRADTIDLQGNRFQSNQDQTHNQSHPASSEGNRTAPHQTLAMQNAEKEARDELVQSPRVSGDHRHPDDSGDEMNGHDQGAHHDGVDHYSNGHTSADEGNTTDGESDDQLDDDMMDKISSSPSIDDVSLFAGGDQMTYTNIEDIDFEFVYALHTFVATVEGQANATKGDTMVLLDDSNSYWWLVRVVKDGSIGWLITSVDSLMSLLTVSGYLPAEHIETPTERLARLNKHRNIDLSATMLGDNAEKSKNPLKKAMRRRNAKTVTFTSSPVYREPSDVEYSTEEEDEADDPFFDNDNDEENVKSDTNDGREESQNENIVVEPLRPKVQTDNDGSNAHEAEPGRDSSPERVRASEDSFDKLDDSPAGRSRNGVVRNTDSFFKDDSLETKKISLTPNLLRDDSNDRTAATNESKEAKGRGSFDAFDKIIPSGDKTKDDKKRKEKKPGMLSGLFKRKDKKSKTIDDDMEEPEKISEESTRSITPPKTVGESPKEERPSSKSQNAFQRHPSKLQKTPPDGSPVKVDSMQTITQQGLSNDSTSRASPVKDISGTSVRVVPPDAQSDVPQPLRVRSPEATRIKPADSTSRDQIDPNSDLRLKTISLNTSVSPVDVSKTPSPGIQSTPSKETVRSASMPEETDESADSPVNIPSPEERSRNNPPDLTTDTSSIDEPHNPSPSPTASSPELVEQPDDKLESNSAPTPSTNTPTWSEASLRSYLDDDTDIRDLLIIVHDKSNVATAGPDHPITGGLFKEESKGLNEMSIRLDELLTGWVARKLRASMAK